MKSFRHFFTFLSLLIFAFLFGCQSKNESKQEDLIPKYLTGYEDLYKQDPRKANLEWFKEARFGLFMHYGLYSILEDGEFKSGDDVLVLVNGCGATTLMEMFIIFNRLDEILKDRNISPYKPLIGNYVTTQEMAGFSLSMAPADDEIKRLWSQPANTPYFKVMG